MNNPIIYDDPTGHSWKDVGQFLYNSATTVADAASGYAYSAANMVMDTERTFLYEPLALAADTLGFGEVAKSIRGTVSQAQSGINASITANVTNETYFDTAKAGMDVAQFAYAAGGMAQVVGKAAMSSEKVAAIAGKAQEKIDILAQKVVQKGEASARELTNAAQKASYKLLTEQGGFARLPGGAGKATGEGAREAVKETVSTEKVLFGQKSVSPFFSVKGSLKGASIESIAQKLAVGEISPNALPIEYIVRNGKMITLNNRSLTALSKAGMQPTQLIDKSGNVFLEKQLTERLAEMEGQPSTTMYIRKLGEIVSIP